MIGLIEEFLPKFRQLPSLIYVSVDYSRGGRWRSGSLFMSRFQQSF